MQFQPLSCPTRTRTLLSLIVLPSLIFALAPNSYSQEIRGLGDTLTVASEGVSLQNIIDSLGYDIDVETDELGISEISSVQYNFILAELIAEFTGAADVHEFGLQGPSDEPGMSLVFDGTARPGSFAQVPATQDSAGVYRNGFFQRPNLPQLPQTWYSNPILNSDGLDHLKVFDLGDDGFLLGWEDLPNGGDGDFQDLVVRVRFTPVNQRPIITAADSSFVLTGKSLEFSVVATDPDGPRLRIVDMRFATPNMIFDRVSDSSGVFRFRPESGQEGEYNITFKARDGLVETDKQVKVIVEDFNVAPGFENEPSSFNLVENDELVIDLAATDGNLDQLTITAEEIPSNADFEDFGDGTARFSLIADYSNVDLSYSPRFIASDGELSDTITFPISVLNLPLTVGQTGPQADIIVDSAIQLQFNEQIDVTTLNANVTATSNSAGTSLKVEHDVVGGASVVKIRPQTGAFRDIDTVEVNVTTGLLDLAGIELQAPYSSTFTTGATVYPGDTDRNGVVDERDILPIGLYFGQTGPARSVQGIIWERNTTHVKTDFASWPRPLAVYADADGSGEVDIDDVCAVAENFGLQQPVAISVPFQRGGIDILASGGMDATVAAQINAALIDCAPSDSATSGIRDLIEQVTGIGSGSLPLELALHQNYPNPFNPSTVISFDLPAASEVSLTIYNIAGQRVRTLANGLYGAGSVEIVWDATDEGGNRVASGVYLYRLETSGRTLTRRMMLVK